MGNCGWDLGKNNGKIWDKKSRKIMGNFSIKNPIISEQSPLYKKTLFSSNFVWNIKNKKD